jgi:hypothetical protein
MPAHLRRIVRLGLVLAWATAAAGRADAPASYKDGVRAADFGDWGQVADTMRQAIAEQPRSTGENVRIYGMQMAPYVPHYYLGLALYRQGDFAGADAAFAQAEAQGTTRGILRARLDLYRDVCAQRLGRSRDRGPRPPAAAQRITAKPTAPPSSPVITQKPPALPSTPLEVRNKALEAAVREGTEWSAKGEKLIRSLEAQPRAQDPNHAATLAVARSRLRNAAFRLEGARREGDVDGVERARDDARAAWEVLDELSKSR